MKDRRTTPGILETLKTAASNCLKVNTCNKSADGESTESVCVRERDKVFTQYFNQTLNFTSVNQRSEIRHTFIVCERVYCDYFFNAGMAKRSCSFAD